MAEMMDWHDFAADAEKSKVDLSGWRSLVTEEAIDPDLPIIDAHHHCWGASPLPNLYEDYGFEHLLKDTAASGHNIVATVYVQAYSHYRPGGPEQLRPVGETERINALAELALKIGGKASNLCAGIVAYADLSLGKQAGKVLDAHMAAAPSRFKGIRYRASYDLDNPVHSRGNTPSMLSNPAFRVGFGELAPRGLVFDTVVMHPQLSEVTELAQAHPETSIVLNHMGGPMMVGRFAGRRDDIFQTWSASMKELAGCPNVAIKIGGINLAFTGLTFVGRERPPTSEDLARTQGDFVCRVIDLFGPNRCMFESNFPVDMLGTSYTVLWNGFKRMVSGFTDQERREMFSGTAQRVYNLKLQAQSTGEFP